MATPAEIVAAIDAAILSMLSGGGAQELNIAGRSVKFFSMDDLMKARAEYADLDSGTSGKMPFGMYTTKPKGVNC